MSEELVTVAEAADMLRLSTWTVRSWLASGKLGVVKLGSRTLVRREEVSDMIERNYSRRQRPKE